ncbi:MAG TPA: hypothetical protein VFI25_10065 [Planctomycetota bacterium]|jgi:hypothetical protein|nr:hypothetical protein [Planctomycetota bacterium]
MVDTRRRTILGSVGGAIAFWVSGMAVGALVENVHFLQTPSLAGALLLTLLPILGPALFFRVSLGRTRTTGRVAAASIAMLLAVWASGPWISLARGILRGGVSALHPSPGVLELVALFPMSSIVISTYEGTLGALAVVTLLAAGVCLAAGIVAARDRWKGPVGTAPDRRP